MPNALNVPAWKLYAVARKGRFTVSVEDAFRHMSEWTGITLLGSSSVVKDFPVNRIEELSDGAEYVLYTQSDDRHWSVPASKYLRVVKPDLTPMTWTIHERNEWIVEHQGLHEGMLVTYDDSRLMPDNETEVPAFAPGILAQINDNGSVVIHWLGYGIEYEVDPSNLEPAEDFPFNPPPYTVISEQDEELERLRAENARLLNADPHLMRAYIEDGLGGIGAPKKPGDAGHDLRSKDQHILEPGKTEVIDTGVHLEIPSGYCGLVIGRSGWNVIGIICLIGLVDSEYRGSIRVALFNGGIGALTIDPGDRIAQMLFVPFNAFLFRFMGSESELSTSERGLNGFGSTGTK